MSAIVKLDNRAAWLFERRQTIGASEVAAILGMSPWESAYSLWAKKVYGDTSTDEPEWQEWGNLIEPLICDKYAAETGRKVVDHGRYAVRYSETCPHLSATLDREVLAFDERGPGCMDAKNVTAYKASDWQDGAPLVYQIQLQAQMEVTGYRWGSLAALIGGNTFRWCDVERNDAFIAMMRTKIAAFWKLIETKTPPPIDGSLSTAEVLKRLYPKDSGESVELPREAADWTAMYERAQADIKDAEERKRLAQSQIIAAIGDATIGVLPDGTKWTYRTQERKPVTVAASSFRVLRKAR